MGAHEAVDPREETAFAAWNRVGGDRAMAVFEAVGVPGMIDELLRVAPAQSRIVVVGVCMQPDSLTPMYGIAKELNVQFVLGYTPEEFAASLQALAEGAIDGAPMITGEVGLERGAGGVRGPRQPGAALQDPRRAATAVRIRRDPEDDYLHPLEEASNFNESRYYNVYDAGAGLGGWMRMGNRPNEGYAELTVCLYLPDGRVGFMFKRPGDRRPHRPRRRRAALRGDRAVRRAPGHVRRLGSCCRRPGDMADPKQAFADQPPGAVLGRA